MSTSAGELPILRSAASLEWDGYGQSWTDKNPQPLWRQHSDAVNARLLTRWLPAAPQDRILKTDLFDEAVSGGLYSVLASRARSVSALDVSPAVISSAKRRFKNLAAMGADVRSLPLESESFDTIVSLSTLDHFVEEGDIATSLSELYRVLVPGGVLIITLDNLANPLVALRNALPYRLTHGAGLVPYPVGKTKRASDAVRVVRSAGFDLVDCTTVMHAPRVLAIPLMNALGLRVPRLQRLASRLAMSFEVMERSPTRWFTGHFVAIKAVKPL